MASEPHSPEESPTGLLELPDPCLLKVLQWCAADSKQSLLSAARAHSRLHQAAVVALNSITLKDIAEQQQVESVLLYLAQHGHHLDSMNLEGHDARTVILRQLPHGMHLSSLQVSSLHLQLQPGGGFKGVLGDAAELAALKQLRLCSCCLLDEGPVDDVKAAALSQMPVGLQHLSVSDLYQKRGDHEDRVDGIPLSALNRLQELTYLELGFTGNNPDQVGPAQPLQVLTRLVDLRLKLVSDEAAEDVCITAAMLAGTHCLTRLDLTKSGIEPDALAGKTKLRHFALDHCLVSGNGAGEAQLLSHVQALKQLTHLDLSDSFQAAVEGDIPAEACSSLTASSKLQYLKVNACRLPVGLWKYMFPAGRQLTDLRELHIAHIMQLPEEIVDPDHFMICLHDAPDGSRLVQCCPSLQLLDMCYLQCNADLLAPLLGLSGLHTLCLAADGAFRAGADLLAACQQVVCRLTGLRQLQLTITMGYSGDEPHPLAEGLLLQLTQLRHLTSMTYFGQLNGVYAHVKLYFPDENLDAVNDVEPVWRQILRLYLNHNDPELAQQAAAALDE